MEGFSCTSSVHVLVVLLAISLITCVLGHNAHRATRDDHGEDDQHVTVSIAQGSLRGQKLMTKDDVAIGMYLGIPYGKPPVGQRRFARPEAADGWSGVRDALTHGDRCGHRVIPWDPVVQGQAVSENCLMVDIYTPQSSTGSPVPTMVFLHGGGFYGGAGSLYNFKNVAARGVVVVSVAFRLDALGFLSTEDDVIPGNFGLLDSILALKWIKANIAAFGGNSEEVTLFGGSSGAAMVSAIMLSPVTRGLYQRAILQSGVSLCPWAVRQYDNDLVQPRRLAGELGMALNCSFGVGELAYKDFDSTRLLECLRGVDMETLMEASVQLQEGTYALYAGGMIWVPVVEQTFGVIPQRPIKLLEDKEHLEHVPTIYGYTKEDGSWLLDFNAAGVSLAEFKQTVSYLVGMWFAPEDQASMVYDILQEYLPTKVETQKSPAELKVILVDIMTDASMAAYIVNEARMVGRSRGQGHPTESFVYEFNHRPSWQAFYPDWYGVGHGDEKGFVLGLPNDTDGFVYPSVTPADQTVADHVVTLWTNFAKYSNPTPEPVGGVTWPEFGGNGKKEQILAIQEQLRVEDFNRQSRVKVWLKPLGGGYVEDSAPLPACSLSLLTMAVLATGLSRTFL